MNTHENKIAVITGAGSGFGRATAVELASRGADIVIVDLNDASETVAEVTQTGRRAISLTADVSDPDQVAAVTGDVLGFGGRVDILVNNAGIFPFKDVWELDFDEWKRTLRINLDSQFLMAKAVMGSMRENGWGRIVNLASNSLGLAVPGLVHYMSSKGGVIGFTRALASDLAAFGITVNAVEPTASRTPGGMTNIGDEMLETVSQMQAIKRVGVATDITGVIAFLTSDDAAFMTGQTLVADGGLVRV